MIKSDDFDDELPIEHRNLLRLIRDTGCRLSTINPGSIRRWLEMRDPWERFINVDFDTILQATSSPLEQTVILLLCSAKMSPSEVARFNSDHFDPETNVIEIPGAKPHNPIHVEIPEQDSVALESSLNAITGESNPVSRRGVWDCVTRVVERIDQWWITPRTFRRCHWALQPTVPVDSVDEFRESIDEFHVARADDAVLNTLRAEQAGLTKFVDWAQETPAISEPFSIQSATVKFIDAQSTWSDTTRHHYITLLRNFEYWWSRKQDEPLHRYGGDNE